MGDDVEEETEKGDEMVRGLNEVMEDYRGLISQAQSVSERIGVLNCSLEEADDERSKIYQKMDELEEELRHLVYEPIKQGDTLDVEPEEVTPPPQPKNLRGKIYGRG